MKAVLAEDGERRDHRLPHAAGTAAMKAVLAEDGEAQLALALSASINVAAMKAVLAEDGETTGRRRPAAPRCPCRNEGRPRRGRRGDTSSCWRGNNFAAAAMKAVLAEDGEVLEGWYGPAVVTSTPQ